MPEKENKELFLNFVKAMNDGDFQTVRSVWSPKLVHHGRFADYGRDDVAQLMGGFRQAFPDLKFHVQELAADGDHVFSRMKVTCTHQEEFNGVPPTGRTIEVDVMGQVRIVDGKIVEHRNIMDELNFLAQLGVVPEKLLTAILA